MKKFYDMNQVLRSKQKGKYLLELHQKELHTFGKVWHKSLSVLMIFYLKNFSIRTSGSILPVIIIYTKIEIAMKMIKRPRHPMANSLLIWFMEYLMKSINIDMGFFTLRINTINIGFL